MAITGRPKSQNPKSNAVTLRITDDEKAALEKGYGTARNGLRAALNVLLGTTVGERTQPRARKGSTVPGAYVDEAQAIEAEALEKLNSHRHEPAVKVGDVYYANGTAYQKWTCLCGKELDRRAS